MLFMKMKVPFEESLSFPLSVMVQPFSAVYAIEL